LSATLGLKGIHGWYASSVTVTLVSATGLPLVETRRTRNVPVRQSGTVCRNRALVRRGVVLLWSLSVASCA
jgi:hypothetical protein